MLKVVFVVSDVDPSVFPREFTVTVSQVLKPIATVFATVSPRENTVVLKLVFEKLP